MASEQGYMLRWGQFTFKLTTAAFQKLSRQDAWRWVTQERLNNDPAEQYVGRGSRVISLEGVIFGAYDPGGQIAPGVRVSSAVGTHQLDLIRYYADQGQPAIMVDGRGNVLGPWVLVAMREDQEYFLQNGAPQKQTFGIEMRYYAPDSGSGFVNYSRTSPIQAIQGVAGAFMDLARKTNAFTGQVATALSNFGLSNDNAAAAAQATNEFQNQNINSVVPYMTDMATLMGGVFGLKGDDYTNGLAILTNNFGATGFNDARSILNTGMPGIEAGLSALGVSDSAAAVNALAFTAVAPTSGDRGVFLNNLGGQLSGLNSNLTALNDIGVNTQIAMGQSQVDRTSALLSDLRTVEATNPAALESVLPAASNAELRSVISNYDGFESARLSIGQSVSTPIPATSMRGD